MRTQVHAVAGAVAAVPLAIGYDWSWVSILLFVFLSIAIDLDHIVYFACKHRTLDPGRMARIALNMRSKMQPGIYILHSPEFNAALFIIALFHPTLFIVLVAFLLHILLDAIEHYGYHKNYLWIHKWSIFYNLFISTRRRQCPEKRKK